MREKWIVETKKGDFNGLSAKLKVSPLAVRCLMNRGVESEQEMREFLYGTLDDLHDPFLMKGMDEAVREIVKAKEQGRKVAIASDFDCDGIFSAYILWKGFQKIGLDSEIFTPDRVKEGYGLNRRIVDEALAGGRDFLVTCDNGIAANEEVDYAKKLGMTVIVTDHHEVQEQMPDADVVLDPKRDDETYPFHGLCGAGVAFKLICALYDVQQVPAEAKDELLEYAVNAPVSVMATAGEGGAWGIALLASYLVNKEEGETLESFLDNKVFADQESSTLDPKPEGVAGFNAFMDSYMKGLSIERAAVESEIW